MNVNDQNEDHIQNFEKRFGLLCLVQVTDDFRDTTDTEDFDHAYDFEEVSDVLFGVRSSGDLVNLI